MRNKWTSIYRFCTLCAFNPVLSSLWMEWFLSSHSNCALSCFPQSLFTQKILRSFYFPQEVWFCKAFRAKETTRLLSSAVLPLLFPSSTFTISEEATQYWIWLSASPDLQKSTADSQRKEVFCSFFPVGSISPWTLWDSLWSAECCRRICICWYVIGSQFP